MRTTRLLWRLYPTYLIITLVALLAVTLHATHSLKQFHIAQVQLDLASRAHLIQDQLTRLIEAGEFSQVQQLCERLGPEAATRITVVLVSGRVVGDSQEQPSAMDNHADRPEIIDALAGDFGTAVRFSHTLGQDMAYVAVPMTSQSEVLGAVRTAVPLTSIREELSKIYVRIALGAVVVALLTAIISMMVARYISRPLERIKEGAERFAQGDLAHRLTGGSTQEIAALAESMNQMASELSQRINTATRQRNEREAILASMVEGVLAVGTDNRLLSMNRSAACVANSPPPSKGTILGVLSPPFLVNMNADTSSILPRCVVP